MVIIIKEAGSMEQRISWGTCRGKHAIALILKMSSGIERLLDSEYDGTTIIWIVENNVSNDKALYSRF